MENWKSDWHWGTSLVVLMLNTVLQLLVQQHPVATSKATAMERPKAMAMKWPKSKLSAIISTMWYYSWFEGPESFTFRHIQDGNVGSDKLSAGSAIPDKQGHYWRAIVGSRERFSTKDSHYHKINQHPL